MSLIIDVFLLIFGFIGALSAFGGETWRKTNEQLFKRITKRGWISLTCLLLALTFGIIKEVRNNRSSEKENKISKYLEQQLKRASSLIEEVPRQRHSEGIIVSAHRTELLHTKLYGGDEFGYTSDCSELYLKSDTTVYYLSPQYNHLLIAGIRGRPMRAIIINKSDRGCMIKIKVYSIK